MHLGTENCISLASLRQVNSAAANRNEAEGLKKSRILRRAENLKQKIGVGKNAKNSLEVTRGREGERRKLLLSARSPVVTDTTALQLNRAGEEKCVILQIH